MTSACTALPRAAFGFNKTPVKFSVEILLKKNKYLQIKKYPSVS